MKDNSTGRTRRNFVFGAAALAFSPYTLAAPAIAALPRDATKAMRGKALDFMARYNVPGMAVAIARNGRLEFSAGFGSADKDAGAPVSDNSRFRIASLSKPITSTAIFSLIEAGAIRLDDRVFGEGGVLGNRYGPLRDPRVANITVDHLLTHTGGGWPNDRHDPMFSEPRLGADKLISSTVGTRPLNTDPGTHYAYSNFGYCILGRIIETVSGQSYSAYTRQRILRPSGIKSMRIAGNRRSDRARGEVSYYAQNDGNPYGMNVARMDAHGGWIASAPDLVRFLTHVDRFNSVRDILKKRTVKKMTTASSTSPNYARGWGVNTIGNWWHTGSLPGTTAVMVRTSGGFCWAALANSRVPNSQINLHQDQLIWNMVRSVPGWL